MKKYSRVSELTEMHLKGKLEKILVEYENEDTLIVSVSYAAGFNGIYDYSLKLNNQNHNVDFVGHKCQFRGEGIKLKRDQAFETEISSFFQNESRLVMA